MQCSFFDNSPATDSFVVGRLRRVELATGIGDVIFNLVPTGDSESIQLISDDVPNSDLVDNGAYA